MRLICEAPHLEDYLSEDEIVDYSHPLLQETICRLQSTEDSEIERVRKTFEFVRDTIHHSCDIQSVRVTCKASEVLSFGEGLCYAKSHLLAALLRAQGIPTGFCYQRLVAGSTLAMGHSLHGLNAVYLSSLEKWIRLDARGNKPGVQSEFSTEEERLAYIVQPELDEIDYPIIYDRPHPVVVDALQTHTDCLVLSQHFLPEAL
ncbi:MAG TPA: transglutaminase family protein [Ktedonobacteraceae bacterium]|nr:transglutaminase family protein [Ktedonobacteraceae bacterium]